MHADHQQAAFAKGKMHPGDAKGGIAMDQDREDPGKQEPVTPEGAHGEQFYAQKKKEEEEGGTR
jgi:hypothetical protein